MLKSGEVNSGGATKAVGLGALVGASMSIFEDMGLWEGNLSFGWFYKNMYPSMFATTATPALLGVGYIIGMKISGILFLGSIITICL